MFYVIILLASGSIVVDVIMVDSGMKARRTETWLW
jgi:precorrin isomerase